MKYPDLIVTVLKDNDGQFFDPGTRYLPFGQLRWQNQGMRALVLDRRGAAQPITPEPPWDFSRTKRRAELVLDPDGALHGRVDLEIRGNAAVDAKREFGRAGEEKHTELIRAILRRRIPTAEVTDVVVQHGSDESLPVRISYRVRAPTYAEKAGTRLIVQPSFFEKDAPPVFTSAERQTDVVFPYPEVFEDHVSLTLPPDYVIEELENPKSSSPEDPVWRYEARVTVSPNGSKLSYERVFWLKNTSIRKAGYPVLKRIFDWVSKQDHHIVMLRSVGVP